MSLIIYLIINVFSNTMLITALIPARGGSKGIPIKNIKLFNNKPLIAYSIELSKECKYINNTVVTSDDDDIIDISKTYGADVPFKRPDDISQDLSIDNEFIEHYIQWMLETNPDKLPDLIVQLRPTYPNRTLEHLNKMIEIMIENETYTSLRTVVEMTKSPYKMYRKTNNVLVPLFEEVDGLKEPYNNCRQRLPDIYLHNGYIDIIRVSSYLKNKSITGDKIYPYIMSSDEVDDIDTIEDWEKAEKKSL